MAHALNIPKFSDLCMKRSIGARYTRALIQINADPKWTPQILKGDPRNPIPPRVMASSTMKLKLGVFGFLRGNKRKQNASTIFARHAAFNACLSSRLDRSTYATDELRLFDHGKNRIPPI